LIAPLRDAQMHHFPGFARFHGWWE